MFNTLVNSLAVRALDRYVARSIDSTPRPDDSPLVHAPGGDPDRILIVGGAAVRGFGVGSYELGIGGHLARQMTALTGCGTDIELDGKSPRTVQATAALLAARDLSQFDVLILMLGSREAAALSAPGAWARDLRPLLSQLDVHPPASLVRLIVGVPPLREVLPLPRIWSHLVARQTIAINRSTERWCKSLKRTTFVPFFPAPVNTPQGYAGVETYRSWAEALTVPVYAALSGHVRDLDRDQGGAREPS